MKKLFLLGLAMTLVVACQKEQTKRYFSESSEIDSFKASIAEYGSGDWETWHTHFADTAKLYINSLKSISATDLENAQKEMLSNFSSYGFQEKGSFAEMVIDKDDETWVNYWANWRGTLKENGKEIDVPVHITAQYIDGKVVQMYDYYDSALIANEFQAIEAINKMSVDDKAIYTTINKMIPIWNKNDHQALKELSVPNLIRNANGSRQASSQDEYAAMMTSFFTGFSDFKVALEDTKINGNKATISWRCTGTNNGEFLGNAPTNKKVNIQGMSVWSFNGEGKAIQEDAFFDNLTMFQQLGYKEVPSL